MSVLSAFVLLACLLHGQNTVAQDPTTAPPTITVTAAVPTSTAPSDTLLPPQAPLPPRQAWCPSEIFCAGPLLQTVNVAHLFPDDKTFIDKPTSKSPQEVLADFRNISSSNTNATFGQVLSFVNQDFSGEGRELQALALEAFNPNPAFLNNVTDTLVRAWSQTVHGFWTQLIRGTNESNLCGVGSDCESSLIPLNHTFVVPGGRFREQYYWDSFWIVEGLIESELFDIVNATLQNFMDELDTIGFIPNGGRVYYLNRSQPPLFIQMLDRYVTTSGDRSILERALPLAERELAWWRANRSVNVTSPFTNERRLVYHYNVNNSAPRPESYLTDYLTANGPEVDPPLNDTQKAALYAELASGAESGWDYTIRWFADGENDGSLRNLHVRNAIAVDLNSILYRSHVVVSRLYGSSNRARSNSHRRTADALRESVLDLLWDSERLAFYDFDIATNQRRNFFSAANFYPVWSGIIPDVLLRDRNAAFGHFSSLNLVLNRYNGTFPATFVDTGLQWDAPNAWPPHQYVVLQALRNLPSNITSGPVPAPGDGQSTFNLIPSGQLGLSENQLPQQPRHNSSDANYPSSGPGTDINTLDGTVINGGNATEGEGWAQALQRQLANRYIHSAFCGWRATGGAIDNVLPRLSDDELTVTQSINNTGNMFEKFSNLDIDSAGRGGEYTVQAGFGWTNGVALWIASTYGNVLVSPNCPSLLEISPRQNSENAAMSNAKPTFWFILAAAAAVALL